MTLSMFSPSLPNLQIAWDSTSLSVLKECPRKYYYLYILGKQTPGNNIHLAFGAAYHKALEIYDHFKIAGGADHNEAVLAAVSYCLNFIDPEPADPVKNRKTLTRTVVWYLEQFRNDAARTIQLADGKPAVELSFKIELEVLKTRTPENEPFLLCGHIDRLVEFQSRIFYLDRKTTKGALNAMFVNQFSPNNQMSLYDFATHIILGQDSAGGIIDAAQIGVNYARFARYFINRTEEHRKEWLSNLDWNLQLATLYAEQNYYPMNDKSCSNYGGCQFQSICARSPSVRDMFLNDPTQFVDGIWNPLEIRGDI